MNKNKIEEIKNGIADYHREQKVLLRLIRLTKGLTQTRFDELFWNKKFMTMHSIKGDSFMLGMGQNGFSEWAWNLDLLQHMMTVGLVDTKRNEKNEIVYVLPEEDK